MNSILNILLLPKELYRKLNDKKATLFAGILFVGVADITLSYILQNYKEIFLNISQGKLLFNIFLLLIFAAVVGTIDVLVFSIPLYDLFKLFKSKSKPVISGGIRILLMKVYITVHLIYVPANLLYYFVFHNVNENSSKLLVYLGAYLGMFLILWFNAITTRGITSIYDFKKIARNIVFLVVYIWGYVSGIAINFIITNLMPLLK